MSTLDAGRAIRARITAALVHDTARHRAAQLEPVGCEAAGCEGSGWLLRASCADAGRAVCPLCRRRVTVTHHRMGVVCIDPHLDHPGGGGAR